MPIAPFPYGITVKVFRGTRNEDGDETYAYSHDIQGCGFAPRYSTENNDMRTSVIVGFSLFGPPGSDILAKDRIVVPGPGDEKRRTYRIVGEAAEWDNPMTGWKPGFEAAAERVT